MAATTPEGTYSYLGPAGTFTETALKQVPAAVGKPWRAVNNVGEALGDVVSGRSVAAMIAIENCVEGGVSATQDALANIPGPADHRRIPRARRLRARRPARHDARRREGHQRASGRLRAVPPLARRAPSEPRAHSVHVKRCGRGRPSSRATVRGCGGRAPRDRRRTTSSTCSPRTSATTPTP